MPQGGHPARALPSLLITICEFCPPPGGTGPVRALAQTLASLGSSAPHNCPLGAGPPTICAAFPTACPGVRLALASPPACPLSQQGLPHAHLDPQTALPSIFAFRVRREGQPSGSTARVEGGSWSPWQGFPWGRQSMGAQGQHSPFPECQDLGVPGPGGPRQGSPGVKSAKGQGWGQRALHRAASQSLSPSCGTVLPQRC